VLTFYLSLLALACVADSESTRMSKRKPGESLTGDKDDETDVSGTPSDAKRSKPSNESVTVAVQKTIGQRCGITCGTTYYGWWLCCACTQRVSPAYAKCDRCGHENCRGARRCKPDVHGYTDNGWICCRCELSVIWREDVCSRCQHGRCDLPDPNAEIRPDMVYDGDEKSIQTAYDADRKSIQKALDETSVHTGLISDLTGIVAEYALHRKRRTYTIGYYPIIELYGSGFVSPFTVVEHRGMQTERALLLNYIQRSISESSDNRSVTLQQVADFYKTLAGPVEEGLLYELPLE